MEILTKEETKILKLIADGASDEIIADSLGCSRGSVRIAIKSMFRVTNTENRYALIAWGFRNNYLK